MLRRALLRRPFLFRRPRQQRFQSSTTVRFDRLQNRLPRFLRPYTESLRNAPISNVVAFLILHEITAVVPLVGLAAWFHWSGWVPSFLDEGSYVSEGISKFGRYFARKGWFGFSKEAVDDSDNQVAGVDTGSQSTAREIEQVERRWHAGEQGSRILIEVATAYAITKVLLPVRIMFSVWATPWFARVFIGRAFGMGRKSAAAGTGANMAKGSGTGTKAP